MSISSSNDLVGLLIIIGIIAIVAVIGIIYYKKRKNRKMNQMSPGQQYPPSYQQYAQQSGQYPTQSVYPPSYQQISPQQKVGEGFNTANLQSNQNFQNKPIIGSKKFCSNCGAEHAQDSKFCTNCGLNLS